VSHTSANLSLLNWNINCPGLSDDEVVAFFTHLIVFKCALNSSATSFNNDT
jgi:transcription initiation factor TFIID subunit TAF12